jgi:hypothetical protein
MSELQSMILLSTPLHVNCQNSFRDINSDNLTGSLRIYCTTQLQFIKWVKVKGTGKVPVAQRYTN